MNMVLRHYWPLRYFSWAWMMKSFYDTTISGSIRAYS